MFELRDTAPHIPESLYRAVSSIVSLERSRFLTEGYLFLAVLLADGPTGAALRAADVDPAAVTQSLRQRIPRAEGDPPPVMTKVSPGYGRIEARAQGLAFSSNVGISDIEVLAAMLWDPCNEVAWVLHDIGRTREELIQYLVQLRPDYGRLIWPPTETLNLRKIGSVPNEQFVVLAPELRQQLPPDALWQPLHEADRVDIWVEEFLDTPELRRVVERYSAA